MSGAIQLGEVEGLFVGVICEDVGKAHFRTVLRGSCIVEEEFALRSAFDELNVEFDLNLLAYEHAPGLEPLARSEPGSTPAGPTYSSPDPPGRKFDGNGSASVWT